MICPNCGREIEDNARFCRFCGVNIDAARRDQQTHRDFADDTQEIPEECMYDYDRKTPSKRAKKEKDKGNTLMYLFLCLAAIGLGIVFFMLRDSFVQTDPDLFDPFEGINIAYSGYSPQISAEVVDESDQNYTQYMEYTLDRAAELTSGDVITLTVAADEKECLELFGAIPSRTEKKYSVSGSKFVTSPNEMQASFISSMTDQLTAQAERDGDSYAYTEVENVNYLGYYLLTALDVPNENYNYLIPVARVDVEFEDESTFSYYTCIKTSNITPETSEIDSYSTVTASNYQVVGDYDLTYIGYKSLSDLYAEEVQPMEAAYNVNNNVQDRTRDMYVAAEEEEPEEEEDPEEEIEEEESEEEDKSDEENSVAQDTTSAGSGSFWGNHATTNGQIFPYSSSYYLTEEELGSLDAASAQDAINEIYARHGAIFEKYPEINTYYQQFGWYSGTRKVSEISESDFNEYERYNIEQLYQVAQG